VATVAGVLLLADFLNVFVTIDRLDPLLVFLRGIFYPFIRVRGPAHVQNIKAGPQSLLHSLSNLILQIVLSR